MHDIYGSFKTLNLLKHYKVSNSLCNIFNWIKARLETNTISKENTWKTQKNCFLQCDNSWYSWLKCKKCRNSIIVTKKYPYTSHLEMLIFDILLYYIWFLNMKYPSYIRSWHLHKNKIFPGVLWLYLNTKLKYSLASYVCISTQN